MDILLKVALLPLYFTDLIVLRLTDILGTIKYVWKIINKMKVLFIKTDLLKNNPVI